MITETYIWSLLCNEPDFHQIITRLENLGRKKTPGLEEHHIEPERERVIYLKPLEHLAIHIAHARIEESSSYYAKVSSFVRSFPGSYRRILNVSPDLKRALISFGQRRPGNGVMLNLHPNTIAARSVTTEKQKQASRENGKKSAEKVRQKHLGREITWGGKISKNIQARGTCCCLICGREMLAWPSNIIQHQRSKKCLGSQTKTNWFKVALQCSAWLPHLVLMH